jgi:HlyD family secretion protein
MNQRANVAVETQSSAPVLGIPQDFIARRDGRAGVWVNRDGRAVWVPVALGYVSGTEIEVARGLKVGDIALEPRGRYSYQPIAPTGQAAQPSLLAMLNEGFQNVMDALGRSAEELKSQVYRK